MLLKVADGEALSDKYSPESTDCVGAASRRSNMNRSPAEMQTNQPKYPETMKLYPPTVSQKSHFESVAEALSLNSTAVFCDTSVLFWLFGLGTAARAEFTKWVDEVLQGRFRIPVWAAHEIHKHMVESPAKLTPLQNEIKTVQAKIKELKRIVSLFADERKRDELLDRRDYIATLDRKAEEFIALCKAAGQQPEWHQLSTEIVPFINAHVMSSNIFPNMQWAESDYGTRVSGRVPPGFKDAKKLENRFGDLIFWREILDFCADETSYSTAVLITDDNKPDWVFRPQTVLDEGGYSHRNGKDDGYETLLAPPLLTHEIGIRSSVRQLYIVNTTMLAMLIERYTDYAIPALFAAVQPVIPPAPKTKAEDTRSKPLELVDTSQGQTEKITASDVAERLKSVDAHQQEQAIVDLEKGLSGFSTTELSALARHLSDTTRTELQTASNVVHRMDLLTRGLDEERRNALFLGLLENLYFDDGGNPRALPLDGNVEAVFNAVEKADIRQALSTFERRIAPHKQRYLALPANPPKKISLVFVLGPERKKDPRELEEVLYDEQNLVEEVPVDSPDAFTHIFPAMSSATIGDIVAAIARRYSVPLDWLVPDQPSQTIVTWDETKGFLDL